MALILIKGIYVFSADEEYQTLKSFLLETECTTIELVYGASMGVAVGYRLFMDSVFTVNHAWFDGVALKSSEDFQKNDPCVHAEGRACDPSRL